ncbi:MAG TPA: hypothetical protein VLN56_03210 [Gammaproteobacteria bacterium]|nr:hypothetical protein [Gammaproteobacteria bacterium]
MLFCVTLFLVTSLPGFAAGRGGPDTELFLGYTALLRIGRYSIEIDTGPVRTSREERLHCFVRGTKDTPEKEALLLIMREEGVTL